jgi:hypothetical protein
VRARCVIFIGPYCSMRVVYLSTADNSIGPKTR